MSYLFLLVCLFPITLSGRTSLSVHSFQEENVGDSIQLGNQRFNERAIVDSLFLSKKHEIELNLDAVKQIQFDFTPSAQPEYSPQLKMTPMHKPWMEFQVDLAVPKSMIDTTKVRKPKKYIRLLPFSVWTRFGEDPVYDVLAFGYKKSFDIALEFKLEEMKEYGRNLYPKTGDPNSTIGNSSVVIGNLDFIGFIYNNLTKQGRIRKHNRKHANAWKTYNRVAPSIDNMSYHPFYNERNEDDYPSQGSPGLYHHSKSIELIEEKQPSYFALPDDRLLQSSEQRTQDRRKHKKRTRKSVQETKDNKEELLEELPNSMDDLYRYIKMKKEQDSIQRKELFRQDKVEQNIYELEQQQRKLKEKQN